MSKAEDFMQRVNFEYKTLLSDKENERLESEFSKIKDENKREAMRKPIVRRRELR